MITCNNISKKYSDVRAVDQVSIQVETGSFAALLGPNGAGKTTLMSMLTGLLAPDQGEILFDGSPMNRNAVEIKRRIGVASQHIDLDRELSAEENLELAGRLYRMKKGEIQAASDRLLTFLKLKEAAERPAGKLSGGMKRKLMLAKALIHNPDYLFLDEPTVGIDPVTRRDIWDFLRREHREGKTILLTTHYIEEAQQLCGHVFLMDQGKIFKEDSPKALIRELGEYKAEYEEEGEMKSEFFSSLEEARSRAAVLRMPASVLPSTLEDVFFHHTRRRVEGRSGGWK